MSFTRTAGAAAPRCLAHSTARSIISSVTSGLAASCIAISPARSEHSRTPARDEAVRSAPPSTTHLSFVIPASRARLAMTGIFSGLVTTTSSSTSGQRSKASSVRSITGLPPSSSMSLSSPIRLDEPAATITAEQYIRSPSFTAFVCISDLHTA